MRITSQFAFVALLALAIIGCHRNVFTGLYSATAEIDARPLVLLVSRYAYPPPRIKTMDPIEFMKDSDFLVPIISDLQLESVWGNRFHFAQGALPMPQAIAHLRSRVEFKHVPAPGNVISITVYSEDPTEACRIANGIADSYKVMCDSEQSLSTKRGEHLLNEEIIRQTTTVQAAQAALDQQPDDDQARRSLMKEKALLDALTIRLNQQIADEKLISVHVYVIKRANAVN